MSDPRPYLSEMPAAAADLGEAAWAEVDRIAAELFEQALALPGDPAEVENDAISLVAQLAACIGVQLLGRLVERKAISPERAWPIAVVDLQTRMQSIVRERASAGTVH